MTDPRNGRAKQWLTSWRMALRLARRDAWQHKVRSTLSIILIMLPVLAVTTADIIIQTQDVSSVEGVDRRIGTESSALLEFQGVRVTDQSPDPWNGGWGSRGKHLPTPTAAQLSDTLGGAEVVELHEDWGSYRVNDRQSDLSAWSTDFGTALGRGVVTLASGQWPATAGEVLVNSAMVRQGVAVGDQLDLTVNGPNPVTVTVVGVGQSLDYTERQSWSEMWGQIGSFTNTTGKGVSNYPQFLVGGAPVDWATVGELNDLGLLVTSRAVLNDPPQLPAGEDLSYSDNSEVIAVLILIGVMVLIEVVLLAGPAFAVGARGQTRNLALIAASGGTPKQGRRVILGNAVVIGVVSAVVGVLGGLLLAYAGMPLVQHFNESRFGPFDVPWLHLAGVAAFALVASFLAAVVPAWIASRQNVVAVLAGRRGDRRPSYKLPVLGLVLLGGGVGLSILGAVGMARSLTGAYLIAGAAVLAVFGMILVVPIALVWLARLVGRLPLVLRFATRDAARHRTRTVPAVAAVAATVAGVVALGIAVSSDTERERANYSEELGVGSALIAQTSHYKHPVDFDAVAEVVRQVYPSARTDLVRGVGARNSDGQRQQFGVKLDDGAELAPSFGGVSIASMGGGSWVDNSFAVTDRVPDGLLNLEIPAAANDVVAGGGVMLVTPMDGASGPATATVVARIDGARSAHQVDAYLVPANDRDWRGVTGVLSPKAVQAAGLEATSQALLVSGAGLDWDTADDLGDQIRAVEPNVGMNYVEPGFERDAETLIIQWVLFGLGAVLMLGGTVTATFLALSDAKPDLATLAAVGAAPRSRRALGASYALVVGFVGAVFGAVVGFIPGIAITYPLTGSSWSYDETGPSHYLVIPWLLIGALVVALPILVAAVMWLCTRSRLPMVSRLS